MKRKVRCNIEEVPYNFSRWSIKFQGHTGWKIDDLNPVWVILLGRSQLSNPSDLPCWSWIRKTKKRKDGIYTDPVVNKTYLVHNWTRCSPLDIYRYNLLQLAHRCHRSHRDWYRGILRWKHFRVTGLLWRESTCQRWIPLTKASDTEFVIIQQSNYIVAQYSVQLKSLESKIVLPPLPKKEKLKSINIIPHYAKIATFQNWEIF